MYKVIPVLLFVLAGVRVNCAVFYVNQNASAGGNGLTWATAYRDLQSAMSAAISGDDIWVATGIYKPTLTTDRGFTFQMKDGVDLYGGFNGTETSLSQRNISRAPTTLSGDIGQLGNMSDNSYSVVFVYSLNSTITIDGFRIIDGNSLSHGGGLYIHLSAAGQVFLRNCIVFNNWATDVLGNGGGIYIEGGHLTIENCSLLNNYARYTGGAIYAQTDPFYGERSSLRIFNTLISGNTATNYAGAVYFSSSDQEFIMDRCIITNNIGTNGIFAEGTTADIQFYNSSIIGNETTGSALDLNISGYSPLLYNLTIAHNNNTDTSAAAYQASGAAPWIRNCIIYGNAPNISNRQLSNTAYIANSIIQGGFGGIGGGINVIDADPQFVNPGTLSTHFDATNYNYTCALTSPAIDAGSDSFVTLPYTLDLNDSARIHGVSVDIGAYENPYCLLNTSISLAADTICAGNSVTVTATGGGTKYFWSGGQTQSAITVTTAGTYSVTATNDSLGCRGTSPSVVITVLHPSVNITGDLSNCVGDSTVLTATGNNQLLGWSTGAHTASITLRTAGTYSITASDAGGCIATDTVNVVFSQNPVPGISFTETSGVATNDSIVCAGDAVNLTATGGATYLWNTGASGNAIAPHPTSSASYFARVTNSAGCSANTDTIVITTVINPPVTITGPTKRCEGQTATLTASGGINQTYTWSTGATGNLVTVSATGTYLVTADNGGGCVATGNHYVDISTPHPSIHLSEHSGIANDDGIICEGAFVTLTGTGTGIYQWNTGETTSPIQVHPNTTTTYIVTSTDAGSCTGRDTVTIEVDPKPVITFALSDSINAEGPSLNLTGYASPAGGVFSGNGGVSGNSLVPGGLLPGNYFVTYTYIDANQCSASASEAFVLFYSSVGIQAQPSAFIRIAPNPTNGLFQLSSNDPYTYPYYLTDAFGKEILRGEFLRERSMDISALPRGVYFLHIQENTYRIVKQN